MEINKIYNEECLEGMNKIDDHSIDLIVCDLPYGTTSCSWDEIIPFDKLWQQYKRVIKENGVIALFGAEPFSTMIRMSNLKDYKYDWYWHKNNVTGFTFAKYQPMRAIETVSIFNNGKPVYYPQDLQIMTKNNIRSRKDNGRDAIYKQDSLEGDYFQKYTNYPNNVLKFERDTNTFHPTQKPVRLLEYLIKTYSLPGDLILDNCMGSGTTAIACLNTDRNFIGFEMNEEYYQKSLQRIEENTTQIELF